MGDKSGGDDESKTLPDKSGADWGLSKRKPAMSRETKIGLVLILVLVGAFGYVVVRKIQRRSDLLADDGAAAPENKKKAAEPIPPYDGSKESGAGAQGEPNLRIAHDHTDDGHQQSPAFPGGTGNALDSSHQHQTGQPGGNPFQSASTGHGSGTTTVKPDEFFPGGPKEPGSGNPFPGGSATVQNDATSGQTQGGGSAWNLGSGSGTGHDEHQAGGTTSGNPFSQTSQSGHAHDGGQHLAGTQQAQDGFQNTKTAPGKSGGPFGANPQQTTYQQQQSTHDGHQHGGVNGTGDSAPSGLFGGGIDDGHTHSAPAKTAVDTTTSQDDSRFGAYGVGTSGQARAHSTTRVQTVSSGDSLQYPFGRPPEPDSTGHSSGTSPFQRHLQDATTHDRGQHHVHDGDRPRVHTVKLSDNYWTISRKAYGTGVYYRALAAYNRHRIPDPKKMRPGMKVLVPSVDILAARFPAMCPRNAVAKSAGRNLSSGFYRDQSGNPMYRVGKTDTLSGIAQKHLGRGSRWIQVYQMNGTRIKNPNRLTIGTELQLPADASNIQVVRQPAQYR